MPIDYSKYPPGWKKEIVPRILKRAKDKCEVCGLKNKQNVYAVELYVRTNGKYGYRSIWFSDKNDAQRISHMGNMKTVRVILTVAHLDHDEENQGVKDSRLKAMCQYCHLKYDAQEKHRRIKENANKSTT